MMVLLWCSLSFLHVILVYCVHRTISTDTSLCSCKSDFSVHSPKYFSCCRLLSVCSVISNQSLSILTSVPVYHALNRIMTWRCRGNLFLLCVFSYCIMCIQNHIHIWSLSPKTKKFSKKCTLIVGKKILMP